MLSTLGQEAALLAVWYLAEFPKAQQLTQPVYEFPCFHSEMTEPGIQATHAAVGWPACWPVSTMCHSWIKLRGASYKMSNDRH